ncbi:MAG: transketolase [Acidobacteriota bacterium]
MKSLDSLCVNTLRFLAVDQVEQARSGHPGLPLGAAPMAYVLWDRILRHNPRNPKWSNRDRFLLSAGHGSALLYSLLHLFGYDLPLDELKRFRQWESKTPGHPEYGHTAGVESTTGPLGQGFANGVGMALAEHFLANLFNRPGFSIVDHLTYAIVSDGDLMEGVSSEAASLAGTMHLGKIIYLYDDNHISIEGDTELAFTENVERRFQAYGWQVLCVADGNDLAAIEEAIREAQTDTDHPSLIIVRNHIGYGSPKQDTAQVHGEPLGPEARQKTRETLDWPSESPFHIPEEAATHFQETGKQGAEREAEWDKLFEAYQRTHPALAAFFQESRAGKLPKDWDKDLPVFKPDDGPIATREAGGKVMNALAVRVQTLVGGSADLAPSTKTLLAGHDDLGLGKNGGRNIHFGVREHAMGAMVNGMALHGGVIPYGSTFLIFSDYMRPALRLAALMQTHALFIFTHDSVGLGEDGPTHQPVEHIASLRLIPGLTVLRPADANETVAAWRLVVSQKRPFVLALTRQKIPVLDAANGSVREGVSRGGYVLSEAEGGAPEIVLVGTGSEVHPTLDAQKILAGKGIRARVVSMPSVELFREQTEDYRRGVLPPEVPKLAVEAGVPQGWRDTVGDGSDAIGIERFGASAPGKIILEKLGFTGESISQRARALIKR